jgi:hypothetical protein
MKLELPALALARSLYQKLAEAGHGDEGTQALYKYYTLLGESPGLQAGDEALPGAR